MRFLVLSGVPHVYHEGKYYAYAPYVQEMNIWLKNVDQFVILAPLLESDTKEPSALDLAYQHDDIDFRQIPQFHASRINRFFHTLWSFWLILYRSIIQMKKADHIHLRCPSNVGLIGCIAQIFFPSKTKTAKYAGNWDWNSQQPLSYRIQQRLLRNIVLTRNMTTLVYGQWSDHTNNIKAFFTASYWQKEIVTSKKQSLRNQINLCFIGTLTKNKRPELALELCQLLMNLGYKVNLNFCGGGVLMDDLKIKTKELSLEGSVFFSGKVDKNQVKKVLQQSHFIVCMSRSEGWPKAVAEAMFWGCVPIATGVSCVPQMLGESAERGLLITSEEMQKASAFIAKCANDPERFLAISKRAETWSQKYTLDSFEKEIVKLL